LYEHHAIWWGRSTQADGFVKAAGDVFAATFTSKGDELASDFGNWPGDMSTNNRRVFRLSAGNYSQRRLFSTASTRLGHAWRNDPLGFGRAGHFRGCPSALL
jgi:hypothetical protein